MAQGKADAEKLIQRNPHPDFKSVEASRPPFDTTSQFRFTQTTTPNWAPGDGANNKPATSHPHREIDPYADGRPAVHNYKLLISGIIPRPIGFVSTISGAGTNTNLAPFSYFNMVCSDPPVFVLGFAGGYDRAKDTLTNLRETGECVVNMISEEFVEAANFTSTNAPDGVSEWPLSGLAPRRSRHVKPDRVGEAVFSIEARLMETREFESRSTPGKKTGAMALLEGVWFWVREDAVDKEGVLIDPGVLKPISRLGGITYGRTTEAFEIPRPDYDTAVAQVPEVAKLAKEKADGQLE